jgi:hypothetical protein
LPQCSNHNRKPLRHSSDSDSPRTNLVGFFVVSDLHIDVASANSMSQTSNDGYALGELGCWLNSVVTRVTQTGEIHSRIPDMTTYIGAGETSSAFSCYPINQLLYQTKPVLHISMLRFRSCPLRGCYPPKVPMANFLHSHQLLRHDAPLIMGSVSQYF